MQVRIYDSRSMAFPVCSHHPSRCLWYMRISMKRGSKAPQAVSCK